MQRVSQDIVIMRLCRPGTDGGSGVTTAFIHQQATTLTSRSNSNRWAGTWRHLPGALHCDAALISVMAGMGGGVIMRQMNAPHVSPGHSGTVCKQLSQELVQTSPR